MFPMKLKIHKENVVMHVVVTHKQSLPMHTLPFLMKPSLQVHTKEPKVFAQVECSGQVPFSEHSSTSENRMGIETQIAMDC